jgi:uncharacterized tellurite resistance protein B-like protein
MAKKFQPKLEAEDHVLLLHALLMMAGADGILEHSEMDTIQSYWTTLPEFRGRNYGQVLTKAQKLATQHDSYQDSVNALGDIKSEAIRKKCYVLAADLAMSSGDVDENEDRLLDAMQRVLNIDDAMATKALEVLAIKYAS